MRSWWKMEKMLLGFALPILSLGLTAGACPSRCPAYEESNEERHLPSSALLGTHREREGERHFDVTHLPAQAVPIGTATFKLPQLLTPEECAGIINATERAQSHGGFSAERIFFGYGYKATDATVSSRDVVRLSDRSLATALASRLQRVLPMELVAGERASAGRRGQVWSPAGLNADFRVARYHRGDQLPTHTDHVTHSGPLCSSAWTLTIYLNSLPSTHGGGTDFSLAYAAGAMHVPSLQPVAGTGLLLSHDVLHAGSPLLTGVKYILRTEVLYSSGGTLGGGEAVGLGLGSLGQYALCRWPSRGARGSNGSFVDQEAQEASREAGRAEAGGSVVGGRVASSSVAGSVACPLEHLRAAERECPQCS